ncbi:MAG: NACHT domain-containing protein, partial [Byssovorax sp.]
MPTKIAGPEKRARRIVKKTTATPVDAPSSAEVLRAEQLVEAMSLALPQRIAVPALLAKHPRLLLVGEAGSGKTTLIAYLATRAARGELAAEAGWSQDPVPFVLTVRSLKAVPFSREALAVAVGCEAWFLDAVLRQGRAFLLVDGLDEARTEVAAGLLDAVIAHVEAHSGNRLLVTTRPAGPGSENQATSPKLASSRLVPMTRAEVDRFIDQWCLAAEISVQKDSGRARAEEDGRKASEDLKARVRSSRAVERLAETPLLCSVLCIVHRFMGQRIPERRAALYEVTTNVLLYEWDRAKFPEGSAVGKLDAQEKRILLGHLARSMHEARVAELSAEQVIKRIGERLPDLGRPAGDARAIVEEIRDRSGVLVERTPGVFAFSHLTFQEYLTALDVVRTRDYELLLSKHSDPWWHEVIALAAGIPGADAAHIINALLQLTGEDLETGTILAASCTETSIDLPP